jgi:hypothetical protein
MCLPDFLAVFEKSSLHCPKNPQGFAISKENTKASMMTRTISTESILITRESNWIQRRVWWMNGRKNPLTRRLKPMIGVLKQS